MPHFATQAFGIEVPDSWGSQRTQQAAIIAAPPRADYQDNVVITETRFTGTVAQAAFASERVLLSDYPGAWIVNVSELNHDGLRGRRITALVPLPSEPVALTALMIQDVIVYAGVAGQFTATTPLRRGPDSWAALTSVLDTVTPLPDGQRTVPAAVSQLPGPVPLDEHRCDQTGEALESLDALAGFGKLMLAHDQELWLTPHQLELLEKLGGGGRLFRPRLDRSDPEAKELRRLGLVDGSGEATTFAHLLAEARRHGRHWFVRRQCGQTDHRIEWWTYRDASILLGDVNESGQRRIGVAGFDEATRFSLAWLRIGPAWPVTDQLRSIRPEQFFGHVVDFHHSVATGQSALSLAPWTYLTVAAGGGHPLWAGVWADGVGPARLTRRPDGLDLDAAAGAALWSDCCGFLAMLQRGADRGVTGAGIKVRS